MELRIRHSYIYISYCVLIIANLEAKSVSLNDIIAAEEHQAPEPRRETASRFDTSAGTSHTQSKKISPLKYRQVFQIKSPSKPRRLNLTQKSRYRLKNLTKKREIDNDDGVIQKYIPLLRNLRMLFDNILGSDSDETYESSSRKFKRNPFPANETDDIVCTCERRSTTEYTSHSQTETSTSAPASTIEIQNETVTASIPVTAASTSTAVNDNISRIGRHKNIPVLFTTNSTGVWRNDSGLSQRSCTPFNGSFEGHITGNHGNSKPNTRRESDSDKESYGEYTDSSSRVHASYNKSSERFQRLGNYFRNPEIDRETSEIDEPPFPRNKTFKDITRNLHEHERKVEYKIRRDETESSPAIPVFIPRLRGFDSQESYASLRATEINKKSLQNPISNKRISGRDGLFASENQEVSSADKALEPKHILPNSTFPVAKVVMIFDGYSVATDVNGNNKLTEKAIHIHT